MDILSPDKIKLEPGTDITVPSMPVVTVTNTSSAGRVMTLVSKSSTTGLTSNQKTILLVQTVSSKAGGNSSSGPIQSLLLPPGMRSLSASKTSEAPGTVSSSLTGSGGRLTDCVVTPARPGVRVVAVTSQPAGNKPGATTTPLGHVEVQTPYGLVFNSRTINADGTVCITKEYLCNFCQFKVSTSAALLDHFSTHVFSCNYCSFRSTSRIDVLTHKRDSHPAAADEIAGFGDLSHPSLVAKISRSTRFGGSNFMPPMIGGIARPYSNLPGPPAQPRGLVFGVPLTSASVVTPVTTTTASKLTTAATVSSCSSSSIARTIPGKTGDNYFTYRIAHDADGKVQAYECDVCGFKSTRIGEMFSHASTHTLADLAKSGTGGGDIVWECFYCSFTAPLQPAVVKHVIATHPNKPIQLKRLLATAADGRAADVPSEVAPTSVPVVSAAKSVLLDVPQLPDESPADAVVPIVTPDPKEEDAIPPTGTSSSSSKKPSSNGKPEKKKKTDSEESCIWGCYYCPIQSASRNVIICHLKKEHAKEKLVVTRRRITHVAKDETSRESKTKLDEKTGLMKTVEKEESVAKESSGDGGGILKEGGRTKRKLSSILALEAAVADGDLSDAHQGLNKSRRKQVAPRRVAEDADKSVSDDTMLQSPTESTGNNILTDLAPSINDVSFNLPGTDEPMEALIREDSFTPMNPTPSRSSSTGTGSGNRKHGRSSSKYSKYDGLIKKLKMAEKEDSRIESSLGLDKLSKNIGMLELPKAPGKTSTSGGTKAVSLLTGQMVSGYVQPTNATSSASLLISSDTKTPVLQPVNGDLSGRKLRTGSKKTKTGLKVDVMRCVRIRRSGNAKNFIYDDEAKTGRCGVCGTTACGKNALPEIREHLAAHFNECRWACDYCSFQCEQRSAIVLHVRHQHRGRPLRVIRRRFSARIDKKSEKASRLLDSDASLTPKLRGPRTHREQRRLTSAGVMWQCPFCCRRSVFRGFINLHVKVAHADIDVSTAPQSWIRPLPDTDDNKPDVKPFSITLVRIEDVEHFPTLSDIIVSNGAGLIHELDVDEDDNGKVTKTIATPGNECALELDYRCLHCHFRGCFPSVVKCHVLHAHPTEDVTFLDMRSTRKQNHEHLFMCRNVECQFVSSIQKEFDRHIAIFPSHVSNKTINTFADDEQRVKRCPSTSMSSSETRLRLRSPSKSVSVSPHGSAESPKQDRHPVSSVSLPNSSHSRRTADGPIEYNDDGTIKGFDTESGCVTLKCFHCDYPKTSNFDEIREHLGKLHPRLTPQALNIEVPDGERPTPFFFCPITNCDFIATYGNVYRHHMQVEHPDSESGSTRSKPLKRKSLGSSVRRQNSGRDVSFTANIRTSKRSVDGMNSRSSDANGGLAFSPTSSCDNDSANLLDLSQQSLDRDANLSLSAGGSSKKSSHYESQAFDFSRRYECIICPFVSATLGDMKVHVTTEHNPSDAHQCIDRRARQLRKRQGVLFCPDIACSFCCKIDKELNAHLRQEHNRINDGGADAEDMSLSPTRTVASDEGSGDRVYQCSHCTYITTDLHNVRIHVVAEHASTEGGFAEIKTAVGKDGNVIMKVNDRGLDDIKDEVDNPSVESVDTKLEGKVYTVL